jgi:hypothetical protein
MEIIFPIAVMLLFCALYVGAYIWMRRPKFGESERAQNRSTTSETTDNDSGYHYESNAQSPIDSGNR